MELISEVAQVRGSQAQGETPEFSERWNLDQRVEVAILVQERLGDDLEIHFLSAHALSPADPASLAAEILRPGVNLLAADKQDFG